MKNSNNTMSMLNHSKCMIKAGAALPENFIIFNLWPHDHI